jgi:hypothetical protein
MRRLEEAEAPQLAAFEERFGTTSQPSQLEVQDALEQGCGYLMLLEARLQEVGSRPEFAGTPDGDAVRTRLTEEIEALREALSRLRETTRSRTVEGFVLPAPELQRRR